MKKIIFFCFVTLLIVSCKSEVVSTKPVKEDITESIYASGNIDSYNQYQVFPTVNGIIAEVFVHEGDIIQKNEKIYGIINEVNVVNRQNAELNASFSDFNSNLSKINDLKLSIELAKNKYLTDSINFTRQKALFDKNAISSSQYEQSSLLLQNSKTAYQSAQLKLQDLKKQLNLTDQQTKNTLKLTQKLEADNYVKSDIKGKVYSLLKKKGEMVGIQTPVAIIGDANDFVINLQVDEFDIIKIKKGQKIIVSMDSYKGKTFQAEITEIDPIMNERSKTFEVEAKFLNKPSTLYPNLTLEANIIVQTKKNVLTIPRNYFINDKYVVLKDGTKKYIQVGLMDYEKVEVIRGLSVNDEIVLPE